MFLTNDFQMESKKRAAEWAAYKNRQWMRMLSGLIVAVAIISVAYVIIRG